MILNSRQIETLDGVLLRAGNLNNDDLKFLLDNGFIHTEWSDYGYKISELGLEVLNEL